ncbi:exo-alpha-sialidase [Kangsaoukella pontilimi]|nr:exo-alpha-sialidase [Kangsaoukella pontilimi]
MERSGRGTSVKIASLENGQWDEPRLVTTSSSLFVNWADFPSVAEFSDGTLIVHWLQRAGASAYAYDVRIALSDDNGDTWSTPMAPHRDMVQAQHGFVTLAPFQDKVTAVWLDGRAYDGDLVEEGAQSGQMQLRSAEISSDGGMGSEIAVDFTTCSCCQTAAAIAGDELLVVYRDRTESEVRDISLVRLHEGAWSVPRTVHADNWEISGCPVDGPSISAQEKEVAVAWFTGAGDEPAVKVAFSTDGASSFGDPVRVDMGEPVGRVNTAMLADGTTLVSWVEWQGSSEVLLVCHVTADGCGKTHRLVENSEGSSMNFPQMAATADGIFVAWTHPLPDGRDTVRIMRSAR